MAAASNAITFSPASRRTWDRTLLAGIGLSSFAALLLELALTRLFSVVLFYHFAFLAISIALLGLGAGGVVAHLRKTWLAQFETRKLASRLCAFNALSLIVVLEVVLHVPVSLELSRANFLKLSALYISAAIPFFFTGLLFSAVFSRESAHIARLYGADLTGGALACLGVVPLLNWIGGPNTVLAAGFAMATAGVIWAENRKARSLLGRIAAVLLVLAIANHSGRFFDVVYAKGMLRDPSWVEFARWNAISRVEVDRQGPAKAIVIDADASTYIMNADLRQWQGSEWQKNLMAAPPAVANILRPHGKFAIIGPGGGVDVLRALANGSPEVTAIEINPIIANTIMRGLYADYAYHLYQRPEVHIHVTDGRSFLRSSAQKYDVVQMTLVDTWASTSAGAFALSENSLYTVEAFREYFDHLNPDGMIAITRWEFRQPREALRVVSVAMEALHRSGIQHPEKHFMVVSQGEMDEDGIPVVVLAKKSPFTRQEEGLVAAYLRDCPALNSLYLPSYADNQPQDGASQTDAHAFAALIASNDSQAFAKKYPYDVSPVTDNAPFFFFTLKARQLLHPGSLQEGIDWKVNLGVVILGMVLLISLVAVLAFLLVPLAVGGDTPHTRISSLLYFVALGLGYILVEIAFIQRFVLFLGHPTYALTVVVFLLLLSSGAGSLASRRWLARTSRLWIPLLFIMAALMLYVYLLPGVLIVLVGWPFAAKLLICGLLLVPLGFAMGMPFPTGLRALAGPKPSPIQGEASRSAVEWAWAMNAGASVLGSVLAIVIALYFGLNVTLACGGGAYLLALAFSPALRSYTS